jgi:trk system potassium uptake protein TrkA
MRIVIVGAGTVGSYLAERLAVEGQDVVVIESDPKCAEQLQNRVDCLVINANGASLSALEEAGVAASDLLIAVTSSDAVNVLACEAAARLGVPRRVARVADPTLREGLAAYGVDVVIDPVEALTRELLMLAHRGGVSEVHEFADGKIGLFGGRVQPDAPLDGITLRALRQRITAWDWIVAATVRNDETFIARGDTMIQAGDHVLVVTSGKTGDEALKLMGVEEHRARKAFVLGGTRLAVLTAELFVKNGINTVLVDEDPPALCFDLVARHDRLVVVKGDPTDPRTLRAEGIDRADIVLGLTGWDEVNILGCLIGKALGVRTAVARFRRFEYVNLLSGHGIDSAVSTRLAAANQILRLVRRGLIHSVATFQDSDAEAIEIQVGDGSDAIGKTLTDLGLPRSAIIGAVVRGKKAFIPHGTTEIAAGDRVIAVALPDAIKSLEAMFT